MDRIDASKDHALLVDDRRPGNRASLAAQARFPYGRYAFAFAV